MLHWKYEDTELREQGAKEIWSRSVSIEKEIHAAIVGISASYILSAAINKAREY